MLVCDHRFHTVLLRQSSGKERKILKESIRRHGTCGNRHAYMLPNIYKK